MSNGNGKKDQSTETDKKEGHWSESCIGIWNHHLTSLSSGRIPQTQDSNTENRSTCNGLSYVRMYNVELADIQSSISRNNGLRCIYGEQEIKNGEQYQIGGGIFDNHAVVVAEIVSANDCDCNKEPAEEISLTDSMLERVNEVKALTSQDVLNKVRDTVTKVGESSAELGKMMKKDYNDLTKWVKSFWK